MGFWIGILVMVAVVIGGSVLAGMALTKRPRRTERQRRQMRQAKAAGAFPHRKESQ
jgi:uncharacterized integral membrane protein